MEDNKYKITYKTVDENGIPVHKTVIIAAKNKHEAVVRYNDTIGGYFIEDVEEVKE